MHYWLAAIETKVKTPFKLGLNKIMEKLVVVEMVVTLKIGNVEERGR